MTGSMKIEELDTPVLLVDAGALERNITAMQDIAAATGVAYRPHSKTHKSPIIANMQLDAGAVGVCCAKLGEAEIMAASGIPDILITSQVVGRNKLVRLVQAAQNANIMVVADNEDNISDLSSAAQTAGKPMDVLIEVDVGQGRCGVPPGPEATRLARLIGETKWLRFRGLQGYQGLIQMTADFHDREAQVRLALEKLMETADHLKRNNIEVDILTGGGSGSSVIDTALGGYTELQPGSYVFMDSRYRSTQWPGGAATPFENSLTILGTVISRPATDRAIVDVGYKAASSDGGPIVPLGYENAAFTFAGDEHGQLFFPGGTCPLALGDKVTFLPSHCDTTVNLYDRYIVTRDGTVEDVWEIAARGRVQ
ncbi:MAG: DSD1 family PLP-dependent enzyme [Rhodospirillales bacterium]|nr:DSD1 family PLP-dependent enzyme [Rhodospirillales bacterium]